MTIALLVGVGPVDQDGPTAVNQLRSRVAWSVQVWVPVLVSSTFAIRLPAAPPQLGDPGREL